MYALRMELKVFDDSCVSRDNLNLFAEIFLVFGFSGKYHFCTKEVWMQ